MRHLKQRRGAMVVMTGIMFFAMVICGAVAIDFSRLWTERSELQAAADAGALAGALQLMPPRDTLLVTSFAQAHVHKNRAMADTITVDSVIKGNWDPSNNPPWTPAGSPTNAVRVVVGQRASNLFMAGFGVPVPRMTARAIAWAAAPVATTTSCIKPWAMPHEVLMLALNRYRGIDTTQISNLQRSFDQVDDLQALQSMTEAERTFTLKLADNGNSTQQNTLNQVTAANMPGNFQAVVLPKVWDYATQSYTNPKPQAGGNAYRDNIDGTACYGLAVGDSLDTETGNKVGPTVQAVEPAVCALIVGGNQTDPTFGDCLADPTDPANVGVDIKTAFFQCGSGCQGKTTVGVSLLGSFTLKKMYPSGSDRSQIVGVFKPVQAEGGAGGGSTTLVKLILVQ